MSKVKRDKQPYRSSLRQEQAGRTRLRILDAAEELFGERGYPATTMESIAERAGVATDTVYATHGSKRGVLARLMDVRLGGDDRVVAVIDRDGPQTVRRETDQRRQLGAFAIDIASYVERARPVDDIMRGAAAVDAEIAALRSGLQEQRYQNLRQFVSWVADNGPLREGLSLDDATAVVWTLTSPEVHRLLRSDRGWSLERYRGWLGETLAASLLA